MLNIMEMEKMKSYYIVYYITPRNEFKKTESALKSAEKKED